MPHTRSVLVQTAFVLLVIATLVLPSIAVAQERCGNEEELACRRSWTTDRLSGNWGGLRDDLEEKGIVFSPCIEMGMFQNFLGGLETHNANAFSGLFDVNLCVDLDKLGAIPGGFFFIRSRSSWNNGLPADVGSLTHDQLVYGSLGDQELFIDKWWYGQYFFDERLELRAGKLLTLINLVDRNAYAELRFSNSGLIANPTVPHRKSLGAYLKLKLCDWADFRLLAVDADQTDSTRCADVQSALHGPGNYIGYGELVVAPKIVSSKGDLPGHYRIGTWYDGRTKTRFIDDMGGLLADRQTSDDMGFYVSFDQLVFKESDEPADKQGLGAFFRCGYAHPEYNPINHFWSVGLEYLGMIPGREQDHIGFGVAQSIMSKTLRHNVDAFADRETVYELFYEYQLTPCISITPDVQVITNPGGDKNARDAVLGGLRIKVAF